MTLPEFLLKQKKAIRKSGGKEAPRLRRRERMRSNVSPAPSGFDRPILVFTMHQSERLVGDVKQAGGQGYVLKAQATEDLVRAVDILLRGGTFFGDGTEPEKSPSSSTPAC